jgi:Icc-related predicted phosphoesterase
MKIYVTSDVHLEFGDCIIENTDNVDVLILGGDIMVAQDMHDYPEESLNNDFEIQSLGARQGKAKRFRDFLRRCSDNFPHVIYIAGNHEFYNGKWPAGIDYLREECAKFPNVYFMENDSRTIGDHTFIGCTLWTDMNRGDPITLYHIAGMMNDYRIIRNSDHGFRRLTPEDTALRHRTSLSYIQQIVEGKFDQKFVVVGHMAPSRLSTHPRYADDTIMNGAYSSSLDDFIIDHPQIKLWTHGHTHEDFDYMVGSTRIVCNPRGYINYEERANTWQPKLVEV